MTAEKANAPPALLFAARARRRVTTAQGGAGRRPPQNARGMERREAHQQSSPRLLRALARRALARARRLSALHRGDFSPRDRASGCGRAHTGRLIRAAFAALLPPPSSPARGSLP